MSSRENDTEVASKQQPEPSTANPRPEPAGLMRENTHNGEDEKRSNSGAPTNGTSTDTVPIAMMKELEIDSSNTEEPLHSAPEIVQRPQTPDKTLPLKDESIIYVDPTPKTPTISRHPSHHVERTSSGDKAVEGAGPLSEAIYIREKDADSQSEIQSIIEQFDDAGVAPTKEEIMSPRLEMSNPFMTRTESYPARKSSLEPLRSRDMDSIASSPVVPMSEKGPFSPPPPDTPGGHESVKSPSLYAIKTGSTTSLPHQPPPPEPEPELPFDFHRFLEQLRNKSADPVAKFLRSFLTEFGKKQWLVHEQVKIIGDFLAFISNKMAQCDIWRGVSDTEFDNAKEGMEKLVMNRLYAQTFSPAIPPPPTQSRSRSRGRVKDPDRQSTGRRGQHQEDVERDDILSQKIRIYSWIKEEHLDISPVGPNGERFLRLAQQELQKIKTYRAPRDKVICILNCCKVIFGLLKNAKTDMSADSFVPLLIYVVLQANPENLVSNVQYILRFRNQDKLGGEAGYYLSSLSGAIQFIESLDRTTLTVSDEEFERNVELAVSQIAAQNREHEALNPQQQEKPLPAEPQVTPRASIDLMSTSPRKFRLPTGAGGTSGQGTTFDHSDENAPVAGLLRSFQRPLNTIGRMFVDQDTTGGSNSATGPGSSTSGERTRAQHRNGSSIDANVPTTSDSTDRSRSIKRNSRQLPPPSNVSNVQTYDAQEAAARQASAEAAEARRIQRAEHRTVVETLCGMFPNLDKEVIDDVVRQKQGRVGLAVDACLALTAGS